MWLQIFQLEYHKLYLLLAYIKPFPRCDVFYVPSWIYRADQGQSLQATRGQDPDQSLEAEVITGLLLGQEAGQGIM